MSQRREFRSDEAHLALVRTGRQGDDRGCAAGRRAGHRHGAAPRALRRGVDARRRSRSASARSRICRPASASGLAWEVVESLPVSEDVKTQSGDFREHIANYKTSLENLAAAGIFTICYNFMPVLDWTRTDLAWRVAHGGTTMRFDLVDFAVFDIHILRRREARERLCSGRRRRGRPPLRGDGRRRARQGSRAPSMPVCPARPCPSLDALRAQSERYERHRRRAAAAELHRLPLRGGAGRRTARHAPLLPSGRSALPAARPAAHHVDRGRLPRDPRRRRQPARTARRSAPARSAPGPTTTCPAWSSASGRASTSSTCAT